MGGNVIKLAYDMDGYTVQEGSMVAHNRRLYSVRNINVKKDTVFLTLEHYKTKKKTTVADFSVEVLN